MKLLLLNAGARDNGATQEILRTAWEKIPKEASVSCICLGNADIKFCKGCKSCYKTGECVQRDDVQAIIDTLDASDGILIAAPSYWADIPGQFKVLIDRCTPYGDTNPNPNRRRLKSGKKCWAIALRAGTRPMECEHIIAGIGHWCGHLGITMVDSMYFCGIDTKEDIEPYKEAIREKTKEWFAVL